MFWAYPVLVALLTLIPVLAEANPGDFSGGVAIGTSYAGVDTAPTNGLIVQGEVGIGTASPTQTLEVNGTAKIDTGLITSLIYPASDSTTAVQIDKANGTSNVVNIDTTNGRVGIGTTSPGAPLTIEKPTTAYMGQLSLIDPNNSSTSTSVGAAMSGYGDNVVNGTSTGLVWAIGVGGLGSDVYINDVLNSNLRFFTDDTEAMRITGGGNVGIANTSPSHLLHVGSSSASGIVMELQNSSGACTYNPGASSVTVSCSSDARLKTDIQDSKDALAWVDDMRVRDFTIKATGERKRGVVAQEIMLKHPEMVHENAEGTYLVDEPNPWNLVKAIQEQQNKIDSQQTEIDEFKKTIEQLKQH